VLREEVRTKSWTPQGGKCNMYAKEQEKIALKEFDRRWAIQTIAQILGYPPRLTLYR